MGNLMNSEIYGNPTKTSHGFVFVNDLSKILNHKYEGFIDNISYSKYDQQKMAVDSGVPIEMSIRFSRKVKDEDKVSDFAKNILPGDIRKYNFDNNVFLIDRDSLNYQIERNNGHIILKSTIGGLPRYPTQIYEAVSYIFIFLVLLALFYYYDKRLQDGYIFGVFLILLFSARFLIEFLKQNQESFEDTMSLNMGQLLSIPFIIAGVALVILKWPKHKSKV